jgi:peptide-methionine (S)-S-oxide reductase
LNRQGADVGTQYRSTVLYTTEEQRRQAEEFIKELNSALPPQRQIVTEVVPLTEFYPAETYHREYYRNNRWAPYCQVVIDPKLVKLHKGFQKLLKTNMIDSD